MKKIDNCENSTVLVALLLAGILLVMGAYRLFSWLCSRGLTDTLTWVLGTASGGMGQVYPAAVRCRNSALAASSSAGCSSRSMAAAHSTLPACTVALWAMGVLLQDTTCQLWQGTWLGHTATWICAVGH